MSGKKKVLVAYATAGIGHKKAAVAVKEALERKNLKDVEIKLIDVLDYAKAFFRKAYCWTYLLLVNRLIFLWGLFYYSLDFKASHLLFYPIRIMSHVINTPRLLKFVLDYKPDVIVSTHFLLPDVSSYAKRKYNLKAHVINIVTDYRAHSFWISDSIDTYMVGHERVKKELIHKWGIKRDKIKVTGIPVEPKFYVKHDRAAIRKKLGIAPDSFTVLLTGGGYGIGPLLKILRLLNKVSFPLAAIAICGHNQALFERVEAFRKEAVINIINLGYVDNVDELMAASDISVGKAGGISTTEAFAQNLPFIFVRPIPGQEKGNADLFVRIGIGIRLRKINDILGIVEDLKRSPEKIKRMREKIVLNRKENAALNVANFIEAFLTQNE